MNNPEIQPIRPTDLAQILDLNNAFSTETSFLTMAQLTRLVDGADVAQRVGEADAMLLAFHSTTSYDNDNFRWFSERVDNFVYVDRIVVSASAQGQGLARILYENLFRESLEAGFTSVVCEVNSVPPNPGSDAFHARLNFVEVGKLWKTAGEKQVRYLSRALTED